VAIGFVFSALSLRVTIAWEGGCTLGASGATWGVAFAIAAIDFLSSFGSGFATRWSEENQGGKKGRG
jgi:hypothetical protein